VTLTWCGICETDQWCDTCPHWEAWLAHPETPTSATGRVRKRHDEQENPMSAGENHDEPVCPGCETTDSFGADGWVEHRGEQWHGACVAIEAEPLHEWSCPSCGATTRARMADRTPPDDWPPSSWGPYVVLRLFARSLVALDLPTMAEARRITSLDDVIRRARAALAVRRDESPQPARAEPVAHVYESTHCYHRAHDKCSATRGVDADGKPFARRPAQCKTCASPCVCPCHVPAEPDGERP